MKNIVLYGMRGCGKTTIGKKLARKLGLKFYDLDDLIKEDIGMSVFDYVKLKGWESFRKKENENLKKILEKKNNSDISSEYKVISLGGGAIIFENNQNLLLKNTYKLVYIKSKVNTIYDRIRKDEKAGNKRNALTNKGLLEELEEVYIERKNIYENFYNFCVNNEQTIEYCVNDILKKIDYGKICVPIINFEESNLIKQIEIINNTREINIVELRIDFLENTQIEKTLEIIKKIKKQIIITNRNITEGGKFTGNYEKSIEKLHNFIGYGDYFDIELEAGNVIKKFRKKTKKQKLIISYHDFKNTPSLEFLKEKINLMNEYKPDIFKIAIMPKSHDDIKVIDLLVKYFKLHYKNKDFIFISMGEIGKTTRISIPQKGGYLSFGTIDKGSAPGQINFLKLNKLIYNNI